MCVRAAGEQLANLAVLLVGDLGSAVDEREVRGDDVGSEVGVVEDPVGQVLALVGPLDDGVVEALLDAVCALDYPRDRLQIQVLDDSTDDTTMIAAE